LCGIAGYCVPEGSSAPAEEALERALSLLAHRGPDARAIWLSPDRRVGFAHARLSVIDPEGGLQPMVDPETGAVVVLNGEIYNFRDLFAEQRAEGRPPRTRSDTEALLTAYARHGRRAVPKLRGMFALAAHDPRTGEVLLARDRMGQKPLYLTDLPGGGVAFASEARALLSFVGRAPEPDEEALSIYLSFGYVPAPRTAWRGIRKLPAAHLLVVGEREPARYWSRPAPEFPGPDPREAAEIVRAAVRDAVRARLVADVPVGAFLSGGLDSATVVSFMAEAGPVRTFTVGTPHAEYDESAVAREVAERFGTEHEEIRIDPPEVEEIPELLARWGEPFGDSSALAVALVSRAARKEVTVALTGDGGDEAFGGYDRFGILSMLDRVPRVAARCLFPVFPGRARRALRIAAMPPWRRYYGFYESFNGGLRERILDPGFAARAGTAPADFLRGLYSSFPGDELDRMLATDAATWLPDDLNPKVDVASMAVALECRSPLQDHLLVEACARLPASLHVRGRVKKAVLRDAMRGRLPSSVFRGGKKGFAAPVEHWFRGDLEGFLLAKLRGPALRDLGVVRPEGVEEVIAGLSGGARSGRPRIQVFILLALALWAEGLR